MATLAAPAAASTSEHHHRPSLRSSQRRTLSKQEEIDEEDELEPGVCSVHSASTSGSTSSTISVNAESRLTLQASLESIGSGPPQSSSGHHSLSEAAEDIPGTSHDLSLSRSSRSQSKVKLLVRSHAVREETSPPPELCQHMLSPSGMIAVSGCLSDCNLIAAATTIVNSQISPSSQQQVNGSSTPRPSRHKLRRDSSSQEHHSWSLDTPSTLSRGNSREHYDSTNNPVDLHQFIVETLNRNQKDRMLLFKIENELINLAKDSRRSSHKFGQMSSYQRMLVHRVAAYFQMEHNVDAVGTSVVVNTTRQTRLPIQRFRDYVREDLLEEPRRSILKRDSSSFDETGSMKNGDRMLNGDSRRSKSFEEREVEYEKVRRRIFNHEHMGDGEMDCCMDEYGQWDGREHHQQMGLAATACQQCSQHQDRSVRLLKVESYESGDTLKANSLRLSVAKSNSFNGYDQQQQSQGRILTKQDSGSSMSSSRISPSSSGYKSQRSDATLSATPSPSATPSLLQTQTGRPYTNADGTIYHYDPANPPVGCAVISGSGAEPETPLTSAPSNHQSVPSGGSTTATLLQAKQGEIVYAYTKSGTTYFSTFHLPHPFAQISSITPPVSVSNVPHSSNHHPYPSSILSSNVCSLSLPSLTAAASVDSLSLSSLLIFNPLLSPPPTLPFFHHHPLVVSPMQ